MQWGGFDLTRRRLFARWMKIRAQGRPDGDFAQGKPTVDNVYYHGPESSHFDGKVFFNPGGIAPRNLADLLKWQFGEKREKWPKEYPSPFHGAKPQQRVPGEKACVTMIGHATLLIQTAGLNLITDPVFADRASPVRFAGPKRVNPPGVSFSDLPPIDYVLLSHNHYDHMDLAALNQLAVEHGARIVCPLGNDTIVRSAAPEADFLVGDWGDYFDLSEDVRVYLEPCHHWSARGTRDRRMALWAAFLLKTPAGNIYHIGDTGFHEGINYKALHEKHGAVELAILPIGAYEPRWFMKAQHQNPAEAVEGHKLIGARTSIGHHWGTFQLTNEAIEAPLDALEAAKSNAGIADEEFVVLRPGENWQSAK